MNNVFEFECPFEIYPSVMVHTPPFFSILRL